MWLVEEMKKNLPTELDFINEGQNTDRVRRMFSHLKFLKVIELKKKLSLIPIYFLFMKRK